MKPHVFLIAFIFVVINACCPKVNDCNCVEVDASLVLNFDYSNVNSYIVAVNKETNVRIDSIPIVTANPLVFRLREDHFKNHDVSFINNKFIIRNVNTGHSDSLTSFKLFKYIVATECNKCWVRKSKAITCEEIKVYELVYNQNTYTTNTITITQ